MCDLAARILFENLWAWHQCKGADSRLVSSDYIVGVSGGRDSLGIPTTGDDLHVIGILAEVLI